MNRLKKTLQKNGINCYVALHDEDYGGSLSEKLEMAIDESDAVIVILTRNSFSSSSVGSEIGYAKSSGTRIIPLLESGTSLPVFLQGLEYVSFTPATLDQACNKISRFIARKLESEEDEQEIDESTEETFVLENGEWQVYPYDLSYDDTLVGKISSDRPVNIFIVNNRNLRIFEDEVDEFTYEEGIERAKKFKFSFQPPREGTWNVIIENEESDDAEVEVNLDVE
jgi:hypothetical protein